MGADGTTRVRCLALPFHSAFNDGATRYADGLVLSGGSHRSLPSCLADPIALGAAADR